MRKLSYELFKNSELIGIAIISILLVFTIFLIFKYFIKDKKYIKKIKISNNFYKKSKKVSLNKKDYFIMLVIAGVYGVVSLWQLGSTKIPITTWQPTIEDQYIIFEITNQDTLFDSIYTIYGEGDNNSNPSTLQIGTKNMNIYGSNDLRTWESINDLQGGSIYQYSIKSGDFNYKYIKLESNDLNNTLTELSIKEKGKDNFLNLKILEDSQSLSKYPATLLIDEQDLIPFTPTYYDEGYFDEVYHPRNAWEIANSQLMYASVHPLLGTSIMALSIKLFGFSPFSFRLPGAVFGILMIPLFYIILKTMFNKTYFSTIGTILFSVDFMHITTSRIATLEPYSVFFILLMFYFMLKYYYSSFYDTPLKTQLKYLALCGISMGIAWSVKWTGIYSSIGLAVLFFTNLFIRYKEYKKMKAYIYENNDPSINILVNNFNKNILYTLLWCVMFFVFIPVLTYVYSYSWTNVWRNDVFSISNVIKQTTYMFNYHKDLVATHPYQSDWYHWLLNIRPVWYYSGITKEGYKSTISNFSNPIISWSGLFALAYMFYLTIKKKNNEGYIILVGFLSSFLPWIGIGRCLFSYHFYPSTPFLIMSIVLSIKTLLDNKKIKYNHVNIYLSLCIFIFIMFMPVITGFGTSSKYFNTFLRWLPSWYFGS